MERQGVEQRQQQCLASTGQQCVEEGRSEREREREREKEEVVFVAARPTDRVVSFIKKFFITLCERMCYSTEEERVLLLPRPAATA